MRPTPLAALVAGAAALAGATLTGATTYAVTVDGAIAPDTATVVVASVTPRSDAWEAKVLALTNKRRAAHGLKALKASACADGFAEPWTKHMAAQQVLEHQDLGPMLDCPNTSWAGENIAYGYETPRALVRAWMRSPGHRANILSTHFHRIGVAGWVSTNGVTYATQDFLG